MWIDVPCSYNAAAGFKPTPCSGLDSCQFSLDFIGKNPEDAPLKLSAARSRGDADNGVIEEVSDMMDKNVFHARLQRSDE